MIVILYITAIAVLAAFTSLMLNDYMQEEMKLHFLYPLYLKLFNGCKYCMNYWVTLIAFWPGIVFFKIESSLWLLLFWLLLCPAISHVTLSKIDS